MNKKYLEGISVVIPCYNSKNTIERAIVSIVQQSLLPNEVILIDDCSSDKESKDILKKIQLKYNKHFDIIILENLINIGPGMSRNRGWDLAKYEYVAFLDSDDAWLTEKLKIQYEFMKSNPKISLSCHSNIMVTNEQICDLYNRNMNKSFDYKEIYFRKLIYKNIIGTRSVMLKTEVPHRFKEGKYHSEDYLLWLEICSNNYKMIKLMKPLSFSYSHPYLGDGLSSNLIKMYKGEIDTFNSLYKEKKINLPKYYMALSVSKLKFVKRQLSYFVNKKRLIKLS